MNGTYYTITEVFDFGPHISKVILDYGKSMKGAAHLRSSLRYMLPVHPPRARILYGRILWATNRMTR